MVLYSGIFNQINKLYPAIAMVHPKIIVIGAGAAGIAASTKLIENGFHNVTVLEAQNRIGGRVHSVEFGGSIVDLGGTWIHGEKGNVVYEMLEKQGLLNLIDTSFNNYQDNTFYLSNGGPIDKNVTDRLLKLAFSVMGDKDEAEKHPGTFGEYFEKVYNERLVQEFPDNLEVHQLAKIFLDWVHKFFLCLDPSTSWYNISNLGPFVYQECEGDQQLNWKDQGYRTILDIMMKKLPDITKKLPLDDKILLDKIVNKIYWRDNKFNAGGVTVLCTDGSSYDADHVIVTTSIGVLKKIYKTAFVPELPSFKSNTIEGVSIGIVNKILIKFPTKWWPSDFKGFSLLWSDEDRKNLRKEFPHGPQDNGKSWLEDVFGFYVIDSHPRVLLGWVVGKMAKDFEELSDDVVKAGAMLLLRKFAGHKYTIPEADEVLRTKWGTHPYFLGSYSHISLEQEKHGATPEDLSKPLSDENNKQTLLFGGEGTHSIRFSTVHGAIETGYREAERILNMYKETSHYKIAIIGAGVAGLGAALKLQDLNIKDFIILEAQNEPGGRCKTIQVNDKVVDLGAQWLHGKYNPIYTILHKHDLISEKQSEEGQGLYIRNDGVVLDGFLVKRVDFEVGIILEECKKFLHNTDNPESIHEYLQYRFNKYVEESDDADYIKEMKLQLLDWHVRFQIIDNSCPDLHRLSAKYWGLYECLDDVAHYNLKQGYKSLIDILVDNIPNNKILCNAEVIKIDYSGCKVIVETYEKKYISCDHLINTMSLGVLKNFRNVFPPLPHYLTLAINNMGFDTIGKIFLFFDYKWWPPGGIQLIWTNDFELDADDAWMNAMTGFEEVFNHDNALLGWVGSKGVDKMESMSEEEVGNSCIRLLRQFLPDYDVPNPLKVVRTQWNSNSHVRGSYCHITPECDESKSGIERLSEPVVVDGVPRIFLAGEAVHSTHYSTVHGAYESGQQQAAALAEFIIDHDQHL